MKSYDQPRLKWLSMRAYIGEGNGNPLQYSCLENPKDGGAWCAAVFGVTHNRTRLKQLSSSSRQHIKKHRHYFANKGPSSQSYGFSSSHIWMWELDDKESWAPKNLCFWTVLEKTLESPLDCKEIQHVNRKGNQSWIFIGRTDAEAKTETPILWPPDAKNWLTGKYPDAGKDWRLEEKGMTEEEMVGWHHWCNRYELGQTLGDGEWQGGLVFSICQAVLSIAIAHILFQIVLIFAVFLWFLTARCFLWTYGLEQSGARGG